MESNKLVRIVVSKEMKCAQERCCFPTSGTYETKKKWIERHDLFVDANGRAFALVDTKDRVFFMDAITGSLYEFGVCLSSVQLKLSGLYRDKDAAGKVLMVTHPSQAEAA